MSKEAKDICKSLLTKNPSKRLGCCNSQQEGAGEAEVRTHPFFRRIDWSKIEQRAVQPPFIPKVKNPKAAENFDPIFTNAKIDLTPPDLSIIKNMRGDEFRGFSFVNAQFVEVLEDAVH